MLVPVEFCVLQGCVPSPSPPPRRSCEGMLYTTYRVFPAIRSVLELLVVYLTTRAPARRTPVGWGAWGTGPPCGRDGMPRPVEPRRDRGVGHDTSPI